MMRIALAAVVSVALALPAFAADPTHAEHAEHVAKPAKEKKICRSEELSGTRLGGRQVCKTKAEWEAGAAATRKSLDAANRQQ